MWVTVSLVFPGFRGYSSSIQHAEENGGACCSQGAETQTRTQGES